LEPRVDEVERTRGQLAGEEVVMNECDVCQLFATNKLFGTGEHLFIDVRSNDGSGGSNPVAEYPQPSHCAATDIEGTVADAARKLS
jgi:hypothetical protein